MIRLALAPLNPLIREEPWIEYSDPNDWKDRRYCAPDLVAFWRNAIVVVEMKLNWRRGRADKLTDLYVPLLKNLYPHSVVHPVLCTRNVRGYDGPCYTSIVKLLLDDAPGPFQMLMIR